MELPTTSTKWQGMLRQGQQAVWNGQCWLLEFVSLPGDGYFLVNMEQAKNQPATWTSQFAKNHLIGLLIEKSSSYGDRHPHHSHQKDCLIKWKYASESIANLGWDYTSSTQMTTVLAWSWFDFVNNFCYCWLKTGSVGDGLTIFSTPCAVVCQKIKVIKQVIKLKD